MTLTLKKKGTSEAIKKASSAASGSFTFENVLPGEYVVEASHPTWKFVTVRQLLDLAALCAQCSHLVQSSF